MVNVVAEDIFVVDAAVSVENHRGLLGVTSPVYLLSEHNRLCRLLRVFRSSVACRQNKRTGLFSGCPCNILASNKPKRSDRLTPCLTYYSKHLTPKRHIL